MEEIQCLIIGLLLGYCERTYYSYWLVNNFHWFLLQMELQVYHVLFLAVSVILVCDEYWFRFL